MNSNICVNFNNVVIHSNLVVLYRGAFEPFEKEMNDVLLYNQLSVWCGNCSDRIRRDHPQYTPVIRDYYDLREEN